MKKYLGGLIALLVSMNMVSAFADCGCGKPKGKLMASVCNAGACSATVKAAPAPAQAPAATAAVTDAAAKANPVVASKDAKNKIAVVEQDNISEEDSEDDE